ncbi:MAG TPA: tail fiber domain-containing protein [Kiritimatiellia bacterium]|nr:tail fiber domain-containing protein [Kiritimatiellia bacterium]HMO99476.1 tail fiber domain-containing protein [Kiritimatiellia bacterium]HMP97071.1 tail fiber domain-containing protein [Kiritimatiellia bacterium]
MTTKRHIWRLLLLLSTFTFHPSRFRRKAVAIAVTGFWLGFGGQASLLLAQPSLLINYQGRLTDGTNLVNSTVGLSLRLYNAESGGVLLYEDSNTVTVVDGLYNTFIGDQSANTNTLVRALLETNVHLEVVVDGVPLSPREPLAAVPYALATRDLMLTPLWNMTAFPGRNTLRNDEFGFFGSTIAGGSGNHIVQSADSVIAGGRNNVISNFANIAFIGSGFRNFIDPGANSSVIVGGENNRMRNGSEYSAIGGGRANVIDPGSVYSTIPGGIFNRVGTNALASMAAGYGAEAVHSGSFVWSDIAGPGVMRTTADNQFLIRAAGGMGIGMAPSNAPGAVLSIRGRGEHSEWIALANTNAVNRWHLNGRSNGFNIAETGVSDARIFIRPGGNVGIGTDNPTNRLHVIGNVQATAFVTSSDRNTKENIQPVEPSAILEKVMALPISTWTFREEPSGTHIGPMAQDFHAVFGFGNTETGIMTVDADGVALAAIQALAAENARLREELEAIKQKLGL